MIKSVLLPQTYLARDLSEALARCFDEVYLLKPPDITQDQTDIAGVRPELFKFLEPSQSNEDIGLDPGTLKDLMHQWESWISGQRGAGDLETIKAGVRPQHPEQEATRAIMHQIVGGAQAEKREEKPPSATPGLVLKLAHIMEKKTDEMRRLAGGLDSQQEHISELLGLNQEEEPPADFQKTAPSLLSSMSLEMEA